MGEMLIIDVLIKDIVSDKLLLDALSGIFNLKKNEINISKGFEVAVLDDKCKISCFVDDVKGDFNLILSLFIRDEKYQFEDIDLTVKVSNLLKTDCLIANNKIGDPYSMLLVTSKGEIQEVNLRGDLDNEHYVIES